MEPLDLSHNKNYISFYNCDPLQAISNLPLRDENSVYKHVL